MKYFTAAALCLALLLLAPLHAWLSPRLGFNAAVAAVEQQYHPQQQHIPFQWFVSLCATISTGGGVRGLRVADFNHVNGVTTPQNLSALLSSHLSTDWHRMILSRDDASDFSLIYVRPEGRSMRMLVATYNHGELDLVRMDLNGQRLAHFVNNPTHSARHNLIPD